MIYGRPEDRPRTQGSDSRTLGVLVTFPNGTTHFYPGATPELALVMPRALAPALLADPATKVEFGTAGKARNSFVSERVVKRPASVTPEVAT